MLLVPECPICLEDGEPDFTLVNCGHLYHPKCITKWMTEASSLGKNCPTCRTVLDSRYFIRPEVTLPPPPSVLRRATRRSLEVDIVAVHENLTAEVDGQRKKINELEEQLMELKAVNVSSLDAIEAKSLVIQEKACRTPNVAAHARRTRTVAAVAPRKPKESTAELAVRPTNQNGTSQSNC